MGPDTWPASIHDTMAIGARRAASFESETMSHTLLGPGAGPCYPRAARQPVRCPSWHPRRGLPRLRAIRDTSMSEPPGTAAERALCATRGTHQAGVRARTLAEAARDRETVTEPLLTWLEVGPRHGLRSSRHRPRHQKRWRACNCSCTSPCCGEARRVEGHHPKPCQLRQ